MEFIVVSALGGYAVLDAVLAYAGLDCRWMPWLTKCDTIASIVKKRT